MSMFVYKGGRGVKNALNSVYVVCTQSPTQNFENLLYKHLKTQIFFGKLHHLGECPLKNFAINRLIAHNDS